MGSTSNSFALGCLTLLVTTAACGPADGPDRSFDPIYGGSSEQPPIDVDGPMPDESGDPLPLVSGGLTVEQAITSGCSTSSVRGLSEQIIAQMNCITPDLVAEVPSRSNFSKTAATFPFMQTPARDALVRALDANPGRNLRVNSMFRTVAQQYILYRWSQTGRCGIGLAARPGRSNHESGLAIDTSQYSAWRSSLESRGFKWFGSRDRVHFDYRGSGARDLRGFDVRAFQMLWNANNPGDRIGEDGVYGTQTGKRLARSPAAGFPIGATCGAPPPPQDPPPQDPPPSTETGRAVGVVWDASTSASPTGAARIAGATIRVEGGPQTTARSGDAFWSLELPVGAAVLTASAPGYQTATRPVDIAAGTDVWASMGLLPQSAATSLEVVVTNDSGTPLADALVYVAGAGFAETDSRGEAELDVGGTVEVQVFREGHRGVTEQVDVASSPIAISLSAAGAPSNAGRIQGVVWDSSRASSVASSSGVRLEGAIVLCSCGTLARARAGDAYWWIDAPPGQHTFTVLATGYQTTTFNHLLASGTSDWGSVGLEPAR